MGIECANCTSIQNGSPEITAVIHPRIVKHNVLTWEGGFDRVDDKGWLSLTGDGPVALRAFPTPTPRVRLNSLVIAGFGYQHYVRPWFGVPSWLEYSYMRVFEFKRKTAAGLVPDDSVQSSLDRYPYTEIAAIDWKILFLQRQVDRLHWRNRYTYSFPERGGVVVQRTRVGARPADLQPRGRHPGGRGRSQLSRGRFVLALPRERPRHGGRALCVLTCAARWSSSPRCSP